MENAARLIITVLFISLMAIGIIFFGFMFIAPLNSKLSSRPPEKGEITTTSLENINIIERETSSQTSSPPLQNENTAQEETPPQKETKEQTPSTNSSQTQPPPSPPSQKPSDNNIISSSDYKLLSQSGVISENEIPKEALKITIKTNSISPNTLIVNKGRVTLAITSADESAHIFRFSNSGLSKLSLGIPPYATRLLTFEIYKSGEFVFYDDIPGTNASGKLIVK